MKKFFKRRGQASVEFALILPIFALLLFALVQLGFLFIDVVTLDSAVSAAARDAAQQDDMKVRKEVSDKIKDTTLFLYWYEMDGDSPKRTKLEELRSEDDPSKILGYFIEYCVQVKLTGKAKDNAVLKMILPEKYTVKKTAYKEEP